MKVLKVFLFFILASISLRAQDYKTGLGVRLSPHFNCIDARHFLSQKLAIEGMLNLTKTQATLVVLAEFNRPFPNEDGLSWYWGLGGAMRMWQEGGIVGSADAILALEYTFKSAPVNLSLDWKPAVEVINGDQFYPAGFGFSVRFVFR